jgi:hypothetical protein
MITENDLKKMKELDIIRLIKNPETSRRDYNTAIEFLLKRYDNMIHKHWWTLQRQLNKSTIVNSLKEEYYSRAYDAFLTAIQKVDLNRVYDDKFKLMQLLSWYLTNVRTTLIKNALKKSKEKSMYSMNQFRDDDTPTVDRDVEEAYQEQEGYMMDPAYALEVAEGEANCERAIKECMSKWDNQKKDIFRMLLEHKKKPEISKELGLKPSKVYMEVNKMKEDLKISLGVEFK